ncbi:MAG: TIGR02466 family protein [Pseudomonadota bacterium]
MNISEFKFTKRAYFPTLIFQIDLPGPQDLNARLLAAIHAERDRDQKGIERSNITALGGWHSHNDLHKLDAFAEITSLINSATARISEDQSYDEGYRIKIGTMWSIINPPGSANRAHVHPGCLWSGVYYIQAPAGAGNIEFLEPRTVHMMNQPKFRRNTKRAKENWTKVRFDPVPGRMIIFPSWLYHAVDTNTSTEPAEKAHRVIISFNLNQVKA